MDHKFDCDENSLVIVFLRVSTVVFSMLDKLLLTFVTDGIITNITVENTHVMKIACRNMITICLVIMIFLIWSQ